MNTPVPARVVKYALTLIAGLPAEFTLYELDKAIAADIEPLPTHTPLSNARMENHTSANIMNHLCQKRKFHPVYDASRGYFYRKGKLPRGRNKQL